MLWSVVCEVLGCVEGRDVVMLVSGVCLVNYLIWKGWFSKDRLPPSFYGIPLLGELPLFMMSKNVLSKIENLVEKHGPILR